MNRELLRRYRFRDDPENPGGGGGAPSPDAGGGNEASDTQAPDAGGDKADADPYLSDPRLPASARKAEDAPPPAAKDTDEPPTGGDEPTPPQDNDDEDESQYSDRVKKRIAKERAKRGAAEEEARRLREELDQFRSRPAPIAGPAGHAPLTEEPHPGTDAGPLPPGKLLRYEPTGKPLEPREDDFTDEETGLVDTVRLARAWGRYEAESVAHEHAVERQRVEQSAAVETAWNRAEESFRAQATDYDAVVDGVSRALFDGREVVGEDGVPVFAPTAPKRGAEVLVYALTQRQNPALLYEVGRTPQLAERLLGLRPRAMAAALDQIEGRIAVGGLTPAAPVHRPAPAARPGATPPPVPPRLPKGGGGADEVFTAENVRGKNPRDLVKNLDKIDADIAAGRFFR